MGVGFFAMRYQPHTHNHTTSRRQQQANLALRSPQGKLQIPAFFPDTACLFGKNIIFAPKKTNSMNAKAHTKGIANPHVHFQQMAYPLERESQTSPRRVLGGEIFSAKTLHF